MVYEHKTPLGPYQFLAIWYSTYCVRPDFDNDVSQLGKGLLHPRAGLQLVVWVPSLRLDSSVFIVGRRTKDLPSVGYLGALVIVQGSCSHSASGIRSLGCWERRQCDVCKTVMLLRSEQNDANYPIQFCTHSTPPVVIVCIQEDKPTTLISLTP